MMSNNAAAAAAAAWLGFSLSPEMAMDAAGPLATAGSSPAVFCPPHLQAAAYCYGSGGSSGYYSQLPAMPLKSDGSLCIMEVLGRTEQEGMMASPSPKLEDFLGGSGPNLGTHEHYADNETSRATTTTTTSSDLDYSSFYYHQHHQLQPHSNQMVHLDIHQHAVPYIQDHPAAYLNHGGLADDDWALSRNYYLDSNKADRFSAMDGGKKRGMERTVGQTKLPVHRKSIDTFGQRTSQYRGVTRHRWTGRYEAHLWDNSCKKEGQSRKGRQVYLGGYDMEEKAARAYDLAALKYWGPSTHTNFPLESYREELEEMKNMNRQEYVAHLRRKSSGFSRGASVYRGVTRHHQHGRWQARIGRVSGNKDLYLGTYSTQEDAAEAYDVAAIKFRGLNAVTNFDISRYDVERIMASESLLPSNLARRKKEQQPFPMENNGGRDLTATTYGIQEERDDAATDGSALLTDFSNNRSDETQEGGSLSMLFAKPSPPQVGGSNAQMSSWMPPEQARATVTVGHLLGFGAAWADV